VVNVGVVWATRMRDGVALLFLSRRQYLVGLTDRRLLVFERRGSGPRGRVVPADLMLGKRYESFALERRRRRPTLLQLVLRGENDTRLVLEFRPSQRAMGRALADRLTAPSAAPEAAGARAGQPDTTPSPEDVERDAAAAFWGSR
jgi:plasmid replication initiation protein